MGNRIAERLLVQLRRWRRILGLAVLAAGLGVLAGLLDAVFDHGILAVTAVREQLPLLMLLLPAAGAALVFVYARWGGECGKGMALVFDAVAGKRQSVPKRLIPLAIGATWVTHLFGGSVGREGVAVQISAAAAGLLTPRLRTARWREAMESPLWRTSCFLKWISQIWIFCFCPAACPEPCI